MSEKLCINCGYKEGLHSYPGALCPRDDKLNYQWRETKWQIKKQESAWEILSRLFTNNKGEFLRKLKVKLNNSFTSDAFHLLIGLPEQEAIKIMQEIEKELSE